VDATRRGWEKRDELRRSGRNTRLLPDREGTADAKLSRRALDAKLSRLRGEQKKMASSGRKTRAKAEREILANADVVLATTVGAGAENIQKLPAFDLLVLDEAAQATEPAAWIPLVRCARAVLVGDPRQLAPLVRSEEARRRGLGTPVMARVSVPQQRRAETRRSSEGAEEKDAPASALLSGGVLGCALRTQYRSHAAISDWASRETYGGALAASPSVATRLLRDLPGVVATAATSAPLLMLDTRVASGALLGGCAEATERDLLASLSDYGPAPLPARAGGDVAGVATSAASFSSLVNEGEAYAVTMHVAGLLRAGVAPEQIAVQSPYAAQVRLMQRRLREAARIGLAPGAEGVEVASVDSFQGREAEAVVVSTVRSNDRRAVGFLADARRANVAVTRARRHVAVVGDSRTVGADPFLARLLAHIRENGLRSPADEHERLHEPLR
jgi:superfamily I DNA and/or RNA helicase